MASPPQPAHRSVRSVLLGSPGSAGASRLRCTLSDRCGEQLGRTGDLCWSRALCGPRHRYLVSRPAADGCAWGAARHAGAAAAPEVCGSSRSLV